MGFSPDEFPNRFDFAEAQDRIYKRWEDAGLFASSPDESKQPYTIVIPPPNVTGALHLGHALNNTLQDIMIRLKRMQGFNALWMPGTDHAGIATQARVEKRLQEEEGKTRHDIGREELVRRIWAWKEQYEARIIGQLKQLGCSCDWDRLRFTLDERCATAVQRTFFDLFKQQLIFRGKRLVNWDTHLQTAVSDDEVIQEKVKGSFWHIRYPVIDPQPGEPEFVTVATTRPETLLGDTAVAVHPDPARALEKVEAELKEKLAKATAKEKPNIEEELEAVKERRAKMLPALETLRDMAAAGRMVELPLLERPIPLVADKWAKPELGSGCVKITPAHDPNDYEVGVRCELPMINILIEDGTLNKNAGSYQGLTMKAARKQVVADLEAAKLLAETEDRDIELPLSDRSKTPIEPFLADQWFVKMDTLAQSAMDAVTDSRVKIYPKRYSRAYLDWLGEKRDWCISRNLWWGHRIPVWMKPCADQAELDAGIGELETLNEATPFRVAWQTQILENEGDDDTKRPFGLLHVCLGDGEESESWAANLEKLGYKQEEAVLDTWFSSALWPHSTLGWPEETPELAYYYPTSTLITSRDIISLWVARMVLTGLNNLNEIPFHEVFIHPKILDGDGKTMSKSKGNGVDPLDIIDKFGADALRFAIAKLTTDSQDVKMPVQFECPHCEHKIDQKKKNRELHTIPCPNCKKSFRTQWAESEEDLALPRGAVVTERFEEARNFVNKLWNASRFALINLADFTPGPVADEDLQLEDRWILSRLATVTEQTTSAFEKYRYSEAAETLYEFAWNELCSFYIEMVKNRLSDKERSTVAQRVLAHALDTLLRLLHPMMPFISEEVWTMFSKAAPTRGLPTAEEAKSSIMQAEWPKPNLAHRDETIETRFALFQEVLRSLREIRNRQNIAPKLEVDFYVNCDAEKAELIESMADYFGSMARATAIEIGPDTEPPQPNATATLPGMTIFVDMKNFIDVDAEKARLIKEITKKEGHIKGKEAKLSNANFVERAPEDLVQRERDQLKELCDELAALKAALAALDE